MALDRLLDLLAHRFFCVLVLFLSVLVIRTCGRLTDIGALFEYGLE